MPADVLQDAAAISGELAGLRHAIHREPEIGLHLPRTQEKVLSALAGLPLEITQGRGLSSVTASLRTFSAGTRDRAMAAAITLVSDIATAHGLTATAEFRNGYPVTVNDAGEVSFAQATVTGLLGDERSVPQPFPLTGAEDFSFVLEQVPGAIAALGACPAGTDPATAAFNHSPAAAFDDAVLSDGAALYAELALRRLTAG